MFKKMFNDEAKIVGLSGFKKQEIPAKIFSCAPKIDHVQVLFGTDYNRNIFAERLNN